MNKDYKDYEGDMDTLVKIEYYKGTTIEFYEEEDFSTIVQRYKNNYSVHVNGDHLFSKNVKSNGNIQYINYYTTFITIKVYEGNDSDKLIYEGNIPKEFKL